MVYGLSLIGCVRRSLTIRTDPPGALVYLNDQYKGVSPVTYDFLWYGGYRVMLRKEGYERLEDHQTLRARPSLWIPFDLAMELMPLTIRDDRTWTYTLTPASEPPAPKRPDAPSHEEPPQEQESASSPPPAVPAPTGTVEASP